MKPLKIRGFVGANKKASHPGRHQEQASKQRCTLAPLRSVQFSSVHGWLFGLDWYYFLFLIIIFKVHHTP